MMKKKGLLRLLVFLLGFSYLVFAVAVPATRIKAKEVDTSDPYHLITEVEFEKEEGNEEGRMMMNMIDYNGARANPAHDPKPPGKPF